MSIFSNFIRGFNENRFWRFYQKSKTHRCAYIRLFFTVAYMRMAAKQGGYVGRTTIFHGKPHFPHGLHGVHISRMAELGENVTIFHGVTIGQKNNSAPKIGNNVICGANSTIIGPITVGDYVRIGGGAIVVDDVPQYATAVSPKAKIIIQDCEE